MEINVITPRTKPILYALKAQPTLVEEIYMAHVMDPQLERIREEVLSGKAPGFVFYKDGTVRFHNQVYVLVMEELKNKILNEGHNTLYFVHLGGTSCVRI